MELLILLILTAVALVTSFFSVIMGGAGLVLTPLMLSFGIPPTAAISSAKFSFLGTSATGTLKFRKYHKIDYRIAAPLGIFAVIGGIIGSNAVIGMDPDMLRILIGITLLTILSITFINKRLGESDHPMKITWIRVVTGGFLIVISVIIATMTGGGAAILITYILVLVFGESFLHSAGTQAIISDLSLITIAAVFIYHGVITWSLAIPLFIANVIGASLGSSYCIIRGNHWIKHVFMIVIAILAVRLIFIF